MTPSRSVLPSLTKRLFPSPQVQREPRMNRLLIAVLATGVVAGVFGIGGFFLFKPAAVVAADRNNSQGNNSARAPQLPISQIVLFSSGVGYFQREGTGQDNARGDLSFPVHDIHHLLKSVVAPHLDCPL